MKVLLGILLAGVLAFLLFLHLEGEPSLESALPRQLVARPEGESERGPEAQVERGPEARVEGGAAAQVERRPEPQLERRPEPTRRRPPEPKPRAQSRAQPRPGAPSPPRLAPAPASPSQLESIDGGTEPTIYASDPQGIVTAIRDQVPQFRDCYDSWLQMNPEIAGRIVVGFTVAADESRPDAPARVSKVEVVDTDVGHVIFEGCVQSVIADLHFAPPEGGSLEVKYPLRFSHSDGGAGD